MKALSTPLLCCIFIATPAWADSPLVKLEGDMPQDLRKLTSDVLGTVQAPPRSMAQARRRAEKSIEQVQSVLRSQGYYGYEIDPQFTSYERSAPISTGSSQALKKNQTKNQSAEIKIDLTPVLKIKTGPQFVFGATKISFTGRDAQTNALETDPLETESSETAPYPAPDMDLNSLLELPIGSPARAANVVATELRLIKTLRSKGYPDVTAQTRVTLVDHKTSTLSVTFRIYSGQKTEFGEIIQTGNTKIRKNWPAMVAPFKSGDVFSDVHLNRLSSRIIGTGVFDTVTAELAETTTGTGGTTVTRNVLLNIDQDTKNTISGELGYSTSDGSGLTLSYERRNFIGSAQTLTLSSNIKTNLIDFGAEYNVPFWRRVDRELNLSAEVARENSDDFIGERLTSDALVTQKLSRKFKISTGLEIEASQFKEETDDEDKTLAYLAQLQGIATYDSRNNLLNPLKGYKVEAKVLPTYNFGDEPGVFTIFEASGTHYRHVSDQTLLAGRIKYGSIVGASIDSVPLNRRFYGGGGGSVRGYSYQSISPEDSDGDDIGGRSIVEGSAEVRYRAPSSILSGNLGVVGFIDAATVSSSQSPEFDEILAGVGMGMRYYTSFAPLRFDIAVPVNRRDDDAAFQIYISIGQSF